MAVMHLSPKAQHLMCAGLCALLALGAVGRRRKPALVSEETNTDSNAGHGLTLATVETQDPMFYLQDSFGAVKWNQNNTYQGYRHNSVC